MLRILPGLDCEDCEVHENGGASVCLPAGPTHHSPSSPASFRQPQPAIDSPSRTTSNDPTILILHRITIGFPSCPSCYSIGSLVRARKIQESPPSQPRPLEHFLRRLASSLVSLCLVVPRGDQVDRLILLALLASPAIKDDAHPSFSHGSVDRPVPRTAVSGRPQEK